MEGSANGKLVIDLTMHHIGRLLTPIELTVKEGLIVNIDGGAEARILRDYLEVYGDENAYMCPAEASKPVSMPVLSSGDIVRRSRVSTNRNPIKKLPPTLMLNVAYGKSLPQIVCTNFVIPYRAQHPNVPKAAIAI